MARLIRVCNFETGAFAGGAERTEITEISVFLGRIFFLKI